MNVTSPRQELNHAEITRMLQAANEGDVSARERLVDLLYDELRWLAHRHLRREQGARIATTELVHEAYLKLAAGGRLPDDNRHHFLGSASRAMRQVLVTEARRRNAAKRSGDGPDLSLDGLPEIGQLDPVQGVLAINDALEELNSLDERLVRVVECRFFGGLSVEETARALDTSDRTVKRDWRKAKAWLHRRLAEAPSGLPAATSR